MSVTRNGTMFAEIIFNRISLNKVERNNETVFSKNIKEYIFRDGELIDSVTVTGANTNYGVIYKKVDDDGEDDDATTAIVTISGIDLTGYNYVHFHSTKQRNGNNMNFSNHYGTAYINARVDTTDSYQRMYTIESGTSYGAREFEFILDISGYNGIHDINIRLYAKNDSTYSGYSSITLINLDEIYLYN